MQYIKERNKAEVAAILVVVAIDPTLIFKSLHYPSNHTQSTRSAITSAYEQCGVDWAGVSMLVISLAGESTTLMG